MDLTTITGRETVGASAATSSGTTVTASGTANAKGTWVELDASTAADACWITVLVGPNGFTGRFLVDVGLGAGGAEAVLLPDLHFDGNATGNHPAAYRFPVAIPAGSRVSARCQCSTASGTVNVAAVLDQGDNAGLGGTGDVAAYGASAADERAREAHRKLSPADRL